MKKIIYLLFAVMLVASCGTPQDIAYFQDRQPGLVEPVVVNSEPFKVRPGDRISIIVKSRNEQLTEQFNVTSMRNMNSNDGFRSSGYIVDDRGEIDFPVLGKIKVAGKNRLEIKEYITDRLRTSKLVDDAIVMVDYAGLYVTVLGQSGGRRVSIDKDKFTIYELLAVCGDLDINAKRKNVLVIREEDGMRSQYELDLTTMKNVYESPAYYVHQNDIVYIEPNDKTKRSSTNNGNMFHTWGFWTGLVGVGMSIWSLVRLFK